MQMIIGPADGHNVRFIPIDRNVKNVRHHVVSQFTLTGRENLMLK